VYSEIWRRLRRCRGLIRQRAEFHRFTVRVTRVRVSVGIRVTFELSLRVGKGLPNVE